MDGLRHLSRPAWLTTGLLIGAVVVPAVAAGAAATVVTITGGGGNTAYVSPANQLRAVEMDASKSFHVQAHVAGTGCTDLAPISTTRGAVIKEVTFDVASLEAGSVHYAALTTACEESKLISPFSDYEHTGLTTIPLGPGVALAAGTPVAVSRQGGDLYVDIYGYTVPAAAATTTVTRHIGPGNTERPTTKPR